MRILALTCGMLAMSWMLACLTTFAAPSSTPAAPEARLKWKGQKGFIDAAKFVDRARSDCGLQAAIDSAGPGDTVVVPKGTYVLKRALVLKAGVTLSGVGDETVLTIPPAFAVKMLTADAAKGATSVAVADTAGLEVGTQVAVRDEKLNTWEESAGIVTGIEGNVVGLDRPLRFAYSTAEKAKLANLYPLVFAEDAKDLSVKFLKIVGPDAKPPYSRFIFDAIHLVRCRNVLIARCTVENWHADGFSIQGGRDARVMDNVARRNAGHGFHPGTGLEDSFWSGNLGEENGQFGLYYCWNNKHVIVSHNKFLNNRQHGVGRLGDGGDEDNLAIDNLCQGNGQAGIHTGRWGDCKLNFVIANRCLNNKEAGILLEVSRLNVIAQNDVQGSPAAVKEIAGSKDNILLDNAPDAKLDLAALSKSVPPDRMKVLTDLITRDVQNMRQWEQTRKTLLPPE